MKYAFYSGHDKKTGTPIVVAVSSYAGKPVRGVAKLRPGDNYDFEIGKKIAEARCNLKVAYLRRKRATNKYNESVTNLEKANIQYIKMRDYFCDSIDACDKAAEELREVMESLS